MVVVEKEKNYEQTSLEGVLKTYEIPLLPRDVLSSKIHFSNGRPPLSLEEALSYPPEKIVAKQLLYLESIEIYVDDTKKSGRKKSSSERTDQRNNLRRKYRLDLLLNGPKRILAAIAANDGKEARFTRTGIDGSNDWVRPSNVEERWWEWIYEQKKRDQKVEDWIGNSEQSNIIHAYYIMRLKFVEGNPEVLQPKFDSFRNDLANVIGKYDNLVPILKKVNEHFDQFSKRR